jgi:hypothetical protein
LRDLGTERLTWDELLAFVQYAPEDSAIVRAQGVEPDPDAWITPEIQMLREIHHAITVLAWQRTDAAAATPPRDYPERIPLTEAEREAAEQKAAPTYESLPVEEMADFLGWPRPHQN